MTEALEHLLSLNGSRTLLTGASGGFGNAIMDLFVQNGQKVPAISRQSKVDFLPNDHVDWVQLDLADQSLVKDFVKNSEPFDNVVFCHGTRLFSPVPLVTYDVVARYFETNFFTRVGIVSNLIKFKKISNPGRIVNVSSVSAHYGSKLVPVYSSSHSAGESYFRSVARYYLKRDVTVNSVAVNAIFTHVVG